MTENPERHVERHPFAYPWPERFPSARPVARFEGGAVHETEGEGGFWVINDEGTVADFLGPDEDADLLASLVKLERYGHRASRDAAVDVMRRLRNGHPGN